MKDKNTIIKKLIHDSLSEEEARELLHNPAVENRMIRQWEDEPTGRNDSKAEQRIWNGIQSGVQPDGLKRKLFLYKMTTVAACLLLVLGIGFSFIRTNNLTDQTVYVVSSGVRSIESIVLPDGTKVSLGSKSILTYPSHFNGNTRDVKLSGQAFFNVAEDHEKPFTVHTDEMNITALGTAFEVFNYSYENKLETILREGKVRVDLKDAGSERMKNVFLEPDQMVVYDKQNNTYRVKQVNAKNYSAWSDQGILSFENERLSMILSRLEPWYGRKIKCPDELADKYRFTFKVRDESIERILFMMNNSSPIKYKEKNGDFELYVDK